MNSYTVKATVTLNIEVYFEACNEDEAKAKAIQDIYNDDYEVSEFNSDPVINFVELDD